MNGRKVTKWTELQDERRCGKYLYLFKHFEFHICAKNKNEIPFTYELENWPFAPMVEFHFDKDGMPTIDLSAVLSKPNEEIHISMMSAEIPYSFYNVSSELENNTLKLKA